MVVWHLSPGEPMDSLPTPPPSFREDTERTSRLILWMGALGLIALLALSAALSAVPSQQDWIGLDYFTYWGGARALVLGLNPYDGGQLDALLRSANLPRHAGDIPGCLPGWLAIQAPAAMALSPRMAQGLWSCLGWAAQVGAVWLLARQARARSGVGALLLAAMLFFPPAFGTFFLGQTSTVVGLAVAVLCVPMRRADDVWKGLAIALAATAKVFPIGLLLWVIAERRWRVGIIAIAGIGALQLPALALNPRCLIDFAQGALGAVRDPDVATLANQSLLGLFARVGEVLGDAYWVPAAHLIASGALATAVLLPWGAARRGSLLNACAAACATCVCAPYLWHHAYVALMPVYFLALSRAPKVGILAWALLAAQFALDGVSLGPGGRALASPAILSVGLLVLGVYRGEKTR